MAKTLKTGDVKRIDRHNFKRDFHPWAVINADGSWGDGVCTRMDARYWKLAGQRIAKIIKRTPKYVFVEVSK